MRRDLVCLIFPLPAFPSTGELPVAVTHSYDYDYMGDGAKSCPPSTW